MFDCFCRPARKSPLPAHFYSKCTQFYIRTRVFTVLVLLASFAFLSTSQAKAQYNPPPPPPPPDQSAPGYPPPQGYPGPSQQPPPPSFAPQQLDQIVQRIALYPDPLLAQTLTASTYWNEIPDAAGWADQHGNLPPDAISAAIQADNPPWDPSVLALLPFPSVLDMMAQDPGWTQQLGEAVLAQRGDVMDAVQRMRQQSYNYGYLRPTPYDTVTDSGGYIEIQPVNPAYIYVPAYRPAVVFAAPRPGFAFGTAIRFGPAIVIGPSFARWGWAGPGFGWREHSIVIDRTPWNRGWANRGYYVHPYEHALVHAPGPRVERHVEERHEYH
jgi:uncharacterized protein DUF3300